MPMTSVMFLGQRERSPQHAVKSGLLKIFKTVFYQLDGLDVTKQRFIGSVIDKNAFHSQGGMDYEHVYIIADNNSQYHDNEFHESGRKWPQVKATFVLQRRVFQHILQTFFPGAIHKLL